MGKYVAKRFVSMVITLFLVATVTFFLMHAVPGQPFEISRETPESVKEEYRQMIVQVSENIG